MLFVLIDIAKIRQHSEQNKLFADFRRNYMRHGCQFVTKPPQAPISCRVEPAGFWSGASKPDPSKQAASTHTLSILMSKPRSRLEYG